MRVSETLLGGDVKIVMTREEADSLDSMLAFAEAGYKIPPGFKQSVRNLRGALRWFL